MTVRAKFKCASKKLFPSWDGIEYSFSAVCADEVEENKRFHKYTPSGQMTITVDNSLVSFELGADYYLDFNKAGEKK